MVTITFYGWMIPAAITLVALIVALNIEKDTGGYLQGIETLFNLIPALVISLVAWVMYSFFK